MKECEGSVPHDGRSKAVPINDFLSISLSKLQILNLEI